MLLDYGKDSDLTLLNTIYLSPRKDEKGKWTKPILTLIYKDNKTGLKHHKDIVDPDYEYYIIKDEFVEDYPKLIEKTENVVKVKVPYRDIKKDIAKRTGNLDFYYANNETGNKGENRRLFTHPAIMGADNQIEDHYRLRFNKEYTNEIIPITKCFLDIELNNRGQNFNGTIEYGQYPVNAVTVCMEHINKSFTFLLRYEDNESAEKFERGLSTQTFKELKEFVSEQVGGIEGEKKFGLDQMDYQILFYDDEISLIVDVFKCINVYMPDFVLAWNMAFDIPYLISRLEVLGIDPREVVCHPDFKHKIAYYYIDTKNESVFAERGDYAKISSYSVYLDQMINFASRRKGQSAISSFSLDNIGEITVGIKKLDYRHITQDLSELPFIDFKTFVFYNIMDTIVQKCIEKKTGDVDYIFAKCVQNCTRYHKGHRQTVYLTDRCRKEFKNFGAGYVVGNNVNAINPDKESKIPGAFVGDSSLVSDYAKIKLNGRPIDVFNLLDDFDFKSLYPSIVREFNLAPYTMIGLIQPTVRNLTPSIFPDDTNSFGGDFTEDLHSRNWLEFCTRWFFMANYKQLIDDINEYYTEVKNPAQPLRRYNYDGSLVGIVKENRNIPVPGIMKVDKVEKGIEYYYKREDYNE